MSVVRGDGPRVLVATDQAEPEARRARSGPSRAAQSSPAPAIRPALQASGVAALPTHEGPRARPQALVSGATTRAPNRAPLDQAFGLHLQKVLGGQTLTANAANPRHLAKMERAAELIGTIERLPGRLNAVTAFKTRSAFELYEHLFPNPDEREPVAEIKARLKTYDGGAKPDGSGFFALGITDRERNVIGYTQGSTVPSDQGLFFYWQYGGVADRGFMKERYGKDANPREHGVLNTVHGVNSALLSATAAQTGQPALGILWESEPRGLGERPEDIQFTGKRLEIHNRAGGRVMMGVGAGGELINLHLQPRLTADSEPIALHMMFRPLRYEEGDELAAGTMKKADGEALLLAWVNNFRVEGFAERDVAEAEAEIQSRLARSERLVLLPAAEVPDAVTLAEKDPILEKQLLEMYGVRDLSEARTFYARAMAAETA